MRLMLQVTDDVKNAAREVKADGSPESLIKLQESIMRRDWRSSRWSGCAPNGAGPATCFRSSCAT
jgi:hypothetical protein